MVSALRSRSVFSLITILVALTALSSDTHSAPARTSEPAAAATVGATRTLLLTPEDTSLSVDGLNNGVQPLLMAYTWPDNQMATAILLKFDLSALPPGATVEQAAVNLALVESDTTADATYTMTAHKQVGMNSIVAAATGYTADGVTPWRPSDCCDNGVPLAQNDISAPYAVLAVDKTPGFKTWTITTMVREWLASPESNFGIVLNADTTKARDRYRHFASTKHPDATLWPALEITYSMPAADDEPSSSQVENGSTTASGSVTARETVTVSNTPTSPLLSGWQNQPAGMTIRTDWGLDQAVPTGGDVSIPGSPGWKVVRNAAPGSSRGWAERASVLDAPFSPSNVYDFVYPSGLVEGTAPATVYYNGLSATELYAGFWWKASSPFDTGPNGNKIAFMFNGGGGSGGQQFLILRPDKRLAVLPEYPGDYRWRMPNVNATVVTLGQWHKIEWYASKNGTLKWWLDGVLQGSYTDVTNPVNFDMFQFSPTWGGNSGAVKRQTDHFWYDHARLSTATASAQTTVTLSTPGSHITVDSTIQGGLSGLLDLSTRDVLASKVKNENTNRRILIKFDTQTFIPANAVIHSARLYLVLKHAESAESRPLTAYYVTRSFAHREVNWYYFRYGQPWSSPGGDLGPSFGTTSVGNAVGSAYTFDLTTLVQRSVNGDFGSRYTRLALVDTGGISLVNYKEFHSTEAADAAVRPRLVITYSTS